MFEYDRQSFLKHKGRLNGDKDKAVVGDALENVVACVRNRRDRGPPGRLDSQSTNSAEK